MSEAAAAAVECEDVWFAYRRDAWVLRGVSLRVEPGCFLSVMGKSGAGKTTLVKVLAGLERPQRGRVSVLGQEVGRKVPGHVRRRVGYIPQQLGLVRSLTALENVLMGALGRRHGPAALAGMFPREEVEMARWWLQRFNVLDKSAEPVFRLSGGERQRVAIARTMLQRPDIVFADEFVSDLDLPRAAEVLGIMRSISEGEGISFVVNMHDLPLVREFSDRAVVVRDGVIAEDVPGREVRAGALDAVAL